MQCKDIPDKPILEFIARHSKIIDGRDYGWCNWYFCDEKDVSQAMPPETPEKLRLAKMKQLIHRGVVDGCDCGCRGDFVLTKKGWDILKCESLAQ